MGFSENRLYEAAEAAVKQSFGIRKDEECLIVTDRENEPISNAMSRFIKEAGAEANVFYLAEEARPYTKPTALLEKAASSADFMAYIIKDVNGEKPFRSWMVNTGRANGRICMMPGISVEMFERLVACDYSELSDFTRKVAEYARNAEKVIVENDKGTHLEFSLKGREFELDVGKLSEKGDYGNLPAGEAFTAPVEESFQGRAVFDLLAGYGGSGVFEFEKGRLVKWEGENVQELISTIRSDESAFTIGEFGIGTNKNAGIVPEFLEAEKAFRTVHFAIGDSYGLGKNKSRFHYDFLISKPSVVIDGKYLMKEGEFVFE